MTTQNKKASVFVALFTMGERDGWLHPSVVGFLVSLTQQKSRGMSLHLCTDHKPIDYARNCAVKESLASRCEWLLMVDNDMALPPNLLDMLDRAGERMDVLVPKFYRIDSAAGGGVALQLCWESLSVELGKSEWCELACAGTGVMFIHRRVFERMGNRGWFRFAYDADGRVSNSEDVGFCQKARRAGFSVWGNQQFEADHYKTVPLSRLAHGIKVTAIPEAEGVVLQGFHKTLEKHEARVVASAVV